MKDRVEFHRKSWTELDSVLVELLAQGSGEALTDPIYFGKKFFDKPLFTYSSDLSVATTAELDSTSDVRDYNHQVTVKHQRPHPLSGQPWYGYGADLPYIDRDTLGDSEFRGWWPTFGDKAGISTQGTTIHWARFTYQDATNSSGVGSKMWMANVLADFSTLSDPASNNWVPITGRVSSGTQVEFTTAFEYTSDLTPSPVPHGHINFVWYDGAGGVLSTSSSSAISLTTSWVEHSYATNPPAGATYVAINVEVHGDGGGDGPGGYGDYMFVDVNYQNNLDLTGVSVPVELMPSTYGDQVGHITDGGFEHQGWLGYIPSWDVPAEHIWFRDFKGWWMQSPPFGARSYEDKHWMGVANIEVDHAEWALNQGDTNGVQYPMWSISSADNYEDVWFDGEVMEPFQGWIFKLQIDDGGRPIYVRDGGKYTHFEPQASGAVLPNDLMWATLHLDEPHNTTNPWRIRTQPGDFYGFEGLWYINPYTAGQLEVKCHLDCYSSSNSFLGTVSTVSQASAEGYAKLNGSIDDSVTQFRYTTGLNWFFPDLMTEGGSRYPFVIQIDSEKMLVTGLVGSYYQMTRGYDSTTPASHINGANIYQVPAIGHFQFSLDVVVPDSIGGGTPHWIVPRYSWVDTSTGDNPEMGILMIGQDALLATWPNPRAETEFHGTLPATMGAYPQATSEWLLRREDPEPRRDSEWCAYYKFGTETDSRWLSYNGGDQTGYWFDIYYAFGPPFDPADHVMDDYVGTPPFVWWDSHQIRDYWNYEGSGGVFYKNLYNPKVDAHYYRFGVWADSPVEIEMRVWEYHGDWGMLYAGKPGYEDGLPPLLTTHNLQHGGSGWEVFEVKSPLGYTQGFYNGVVFFLRIRGGSEGQVVKLDNFQASYDWTNNRENPNVTIGVAEWIKDDRDLYVGARLWLKVA